jgi:hypothetical protein
LLKTFMRLYSYVFHGLLALFLLGISLVPVLSGAHTLRLDMLPGEGAELTFTLLGIGLAGLLAVLLAASGKARAPLFVWSLIIVLGMVWGYFWKPYRWSGPDAFRATLLLLAGAILAALGSWYAMNRRPARR